MSAASHLPDESTKAILFDCDGTLVDTMPIHRAVWSELFLRYDFVITDDWWEEWANLPLLPMVQHVIADATPELADQLNVEAMEMYNEMLHMIEPLEHVIEVAREHHGRLPMAVVTGGYRDVVVPSLDEAGITHLFDHIVTADEVTHSKPAPDLYALAMRKLGVEPESCLVYEDSEIGMTSARGAGVGRIVDIRQWP
ncbi:MAG: HAD family hydrolase [Candidatus Nanopelagicales bacterium]